MEVNPLHSFGLPDIGDHLIHFSGRSGARVDEVPSEINGLTAAERLRSILSCGLIQAFPQFGAPLPVSCFTESVPSSVLSLIEGGRYTPHGVGFSKEFVWRLGGGPVAYMRGDRLTEVSETMTPEIKSMTVRYWPGAVPSSPTEELPDSLLKRSEWLHEREWRVLGNTMFEPWNVAFVIVPAPGIVDEVAAELAFADDEPRAEYWRRVPEIVISDRGTLVVDPTGVFSRP